MLKNGEASLTSSETRARISFMRFCVNTRAEEGSVNFAKRIYAVPTREAALIIQV